jgi:hypothetical protein
MDARASECTKNTDLSKELSDKTGFPVKFVEMFISLKKEKIEEILLCLKIRKSKLTNRQLRMLKTNNKIERTIAIREIIGTENAGILKPLLNNDVINEIVTYLLK